MGWGSYYLFWLIAPAILALVSSHPSVLILVVVALVLRRWIPDPYLFFKYVGRTTSLSTQIAANPENATARRELAVIYLAKRRPAKAVPHLEQALRREPDAAELHYLLGLAHLGRKAYADAVQAFSLALHEDERIHYGDSYLQCGNALLKLDRLDEATEAYQRFLKINGSSIEARYRLALICEKKKDEAGAKKIVADAIETYKQLPPFARRKQFFWYLRVRF